MQTSLRLPLLALAILMSPAASANAQQSAAPAPIPLPPAADVIARFVKAAKVNVLVESHTSTRTKAKLEVPAMGLTGNIVEVRSKPNRFVQSVTMTGRGESKSGFDGEYAWTLDPAAGPKLLAGTDLADRRTAATYAAPMRDASLYKSRETVEIAEYGGQKCNKLRMVTLAGTESFECFSVETGLLVAALRKEGTIDNLSLYSDYKEFGGVVIATKIVSERAGIKRVLTIESLTFDDVKAAELVLPPQVKALIKP